MSSEQQKKGVGCGGIILLLIIGIVIVSIVYGNISIKSETEVFESAVAYLDKKINLSGYTSSKKDDKYDHKYWYNEPAVDYPAPKTPLMLEGNVKYVAGVTKVSDFIKAGYKPDDDAPIYISANDSNFLTLNYKNKSLHISVKNNKSQEQKTVDCLVKGMTLYPGNDAISFDYLSLNNSSTLNEMIEALGKPNGTNVYYAVKVEKARDGKARYEFCYHYKGDVMITVEMYYHSQDNSTTMAKVTVY